MAALHAPQRHQDSGAGRPVGAGPLVIRITRPTLTLGRKLGQFRFQAALFPGWAAGVVTALATWMAYAAESVPSFSATALTGRAVTKADLVGAPTVLILTPSKKAAMDTRLWAKDLRHSLNHKVRVRDVLAIDLPFFMSEPDAIGRFKKNIPARYYDQTWLMA